MIAGRLIAALAAAAALIGAVPAMAQESTGLKRLTLRQDLLGWEAVGRVEIGEGFCTGTLIAPDTVLTAAHCVFDRATGAMRPVETLSFRAGLRDGEAIATRAVSAVAAHPRYVYQGGRSSAQSVRYDVAILRLDAAIPAGVAPPFTVGAGTPGKVSVVSYAQGREEALSRQRVCGVLGAQGGLFAFDCDVYFGSSGAPVFDMSGRRAKIVSIVSAGVRDADRTLSFGMTLAPLIEDLKTALRTGKGQVATADRAPASRRLRVGTLSEGSGGGGSGIRFLKPQ